MKTRTVKEKDLVVHGRWDIDYHLPPVGITKFPKEIVVPVSKCADIIRATTDPTKRLDTSFKYVDISSVDVTTGTIQTPQELTGAEAPSRARKLIRAYDIIISTCRPTRGAIAIVPESLHGEICSTGFSVVRAKAGVNPFYLHFALRLESTLEQLRKWSTGSSYPAILDEDVAKTLIPLPSPEIQDAIARTLQAGLARRDKAIADANAEWQTTYASQVGYVQGQVKTPPTNGVPSGIPTTVKEIAERVKALGIPKLELVRTARAGRSGKPAKGAALFDKQMKPDKASVKK